MSVRRFRIRTACVTTVLSYIVIALNTFPTYEFTPNINTVSNYRCHHSIDGDDAAGDIDFHEDRRSVLGKAILSASTITAFCSIISNSKSCSAITPSDVRVHYDEYASSYDEIDGGPIAEVLGIDEARTMLIQSAKGRVLEVGAGTGLNLDKYNFANSIEPDGVTTLTLVDLSMNMLQKAQEKLNQLVDIPRENVHLVVADATTDLVGVFGVDQFDTVIDTFSLCVMGNDGARKCLRQLRDVVKPTGTILLLENTRSSNNFIGLYQDLTSEMAASWGGKGCLYNQDVNSLISETEGLYTVSSGEIAAGLFTNFTCAKN